MIQKQIRELKKLGTDLPELSTNIVEDDDQPQAQQVVEYIYSAALASTPGMPRNYKEAVNGKDKEQWVSGMIKELTNFETRQVLKVVPRSSVPDKQKILKSRWVMKKKEKQGQETVFRARLVVKGYDQIPGVDFTESFALTTNDTTTWTLLVIALNNAEPKGWVIGLISIETAFLEADLDEPTWIEIPKGYEYINDMINREKNVALLTKAMYRLVQAPRSLYNKFRQVLTTQEVGLT